jgi:hypothetical protein
MPPVLSVIRIVIISKVIISIVIVFYNKDKMSQNLKERQKNGKKSFIIWTRWSNKNIVFCIFFDLVKFYQQCNSSSNVLRATRYLEQQDT